MHYYLPLIFSCLLVSATAGATAARPLQRDVVIVGGGSSGTYAAVRLQQLGKSVALIEKDNRLGGHTNTYVDATTGQTFDYGTQVLVNITVVRDFFSYLNTPLGKFAPGGSNVAVDIGRETLGPPWPVVSANATANALQRYKIQLAKYPPDLFLGYDVPYPVPEDLLITWGDFLQKYNLGALAYNGFLQFQGSGNLLAQPTLYVMKLFNPTQVQSREQGLSVAEANHNMQALWNSAQAVLGADNVFLQSNILQIDRSCSDFVSVRFSTPTGVQTIHAKKLLMTIPPKLHLLTPFFDLTPSETELFSQFNSSYYSNAVLAHTNFPNNTSVYNYDNHALFGIPALPGPYYFTATGVSDLYAVQYSSPYDQTDEEVDRVLLDSVRRARKALGVGEPSTSTSVVKSNNHSPFLLAVTPSKIADGFYRNLTALEGPKNTYWTGGTWTAGSSSIIWKFTEEIILPQILAALN